MYFGNELFFEDIFDLNVYVIFLFIRVHYLLPEFLTLFVPNRLVPFQLVIHEIYRNI